MVPRVDALINATNIWLRSSRSAQSISVPAGDVAASIGFLAVAGLKPALLRYRGRPPVVHRRWPRTCKADCAGKGPESQPGFLPKLGPSQSPGCDGLFCDGAAPCSRAAFCGALIHISTDFHSNGSATERERRTDAPEISEARLPRFQEPSEISNPVKQRKTQGGKAPGDRKYKFR
jgi:hypothetical protein